MKVLYLLINVFTIIIPVVFSFHQKLDFYKRWRAFFISNVLVAIVFILWDVLFTQMGIWGFNSNYVLGPYFFNLPFEEVLFFGCIPFACVFTYHCMNLFLKTDWEVKTENTVVFLFSVSLLIIGVYFHNRLYTATTFISLAIFLVVLKYVFKVKWLGKLLSIYPFLLIPFFIVNGILTGSGLQQPVVWYNNHENMGIRLLTIPLEDVFYGFELILLNVFLYEYFKKRQALLEA